MLSNEAQDDRERYSELLRIYAQLELDRCQMLIYLHKLTSRVGLEFNLNHAMGERMSVDEAIAYITSVNDDRIGKFKEINPLRYFLRGVP